MPLGGAVLAEDVALNKDTPIGQDFFYSAAGEPTDTTLALSRPIIGGNWGGEGASRFFGRH